MGIDLKIYKEKIEGYDNYCGYDRQCKEGGTQLGSLFLWFIIVCVVFNLGKLFGESNKKVVSIDFKFGDFVRLHNQPHKYVVLEVHDKVVQIQSSISNAFVVGKDCVKRWDK